MRRDGIHKTMLRCSLLIYDDDNVVDQPVEEDDGAFGHVRPQPLALLERRHGEAVPGDLK